MKDLTILRQSPPYLRAGEAEEHGWHDDSGQEADCDALGEVGRHRTECDGGSAHIDDQQHERAHQCTWKLREHWAGDALPPRRRPQRQWLQDW